jgi:hypothetical protein
MVVGNSQNQPGRKMYRPFTSYVSPQFYNQTFDAKGNLNTLDIINPKSFDPLNEDIDLKWAGKVDDTAKFSNYYDYYFSGEDVKIYMDGLFDAGDELDIANFAFLIKQEKQPLYGFWSYNYDVMMTGTRIISGEFSVYSRYPGRMRDLLSKAADQRAKAFKEGKDSKRIQSKLLSGAESDEDEKNIQKYWANGNRGAGSLDRLSGDSVSSDTRNIFSAHPPFNFIVKYGTQEGSVTTIGTNKGTNNEDNFSVLDRMMATDYNERLVQKTASSSMDIVLQSIQLMSMTTSYAPGGQALIETYQFLARDMYVSDGGIRKPVSTSPSTASSDSSGARATSATTGTADLTAAEITAIAAGLNITGFGTVQ